MAPRRLLPILIRSLVGSLKEVVRVSRDAHLLETAAGGVLEVK